MTRNLEDLSGRLVLGQPGRRNYCRLAETLTAPIVAILETTISEPAMPDWQRLILKTAQFRVMPTSWITTLKQWRGVYLIVDESDGSRYVGSASGVDNLYGRWDEHTKKIYGITVGLRNRSSENFRFSILERVAPDLGSDEVSRLEQTWMLRLHTRRFGLNVGTA